MKNQRSHPVPTRARVWPKYKVNAWFNVRTENVKFGIDVKLAPGEPWRHLVSDNKPLFFQKRERAEAWITKRVRTVREQGAAS